MTWLEAVEVADMEPVEAAELFAQTPKLQNVRPDMETEVALISQGAWISRARDLIGCTICGGYSAVCSRTSDDNLARISNQKNSSGR